jgi:hypothetical protein
MAFAMLVSSLPAPALAEGHLLPSSRIEGALQGAARARAQDKARLDALLASEEAAQAASRLGVGIDKVRTAAARLSDAERRDLLARADALAADPAARYMDPDIKQLLTILLIVLIVVVILDAVD